MASTDEKTDQETTAIAAAEVKPLVEEQCPIKRGSCRQIDLCTSQGADGKPRSILSFNPVVTLIGALLLWGFVVVILVMSADDIAVEDTAFTTMKAWQSWVTDNFTWFYIGSQDIWILFMVAVYWYFGDVKLGKPDGVPEFSDSTYFMMVFCSGVAVGLFFYGVSEPRFHLNSHRFAAAGYRSDDERAQYALDLTIYHWGLHGFIVYTLVAILLGFVSFKKGLTLTIRSCFYPLMGDRIYGWIGDIIDSFTIFTVVAGVCTSLGLGTIQIVTGLQRLEVLDPTCAEGAVDTSDCYTDDNLTNARIVVIWSITFVATLSVVSGIQYGIKTLSQIAFVMAAFIWLMVFFMDDTWFFLNLMVQTTGSYFQRIVGLGFHTDAFGQLQPADGGAPDGKGGAAKWMDWWTIFYWGWWIAWSPFVGMFVAKISKNRTIKEVCHVTLSGPLLFAIIWFSVFGGAGFQHSRRALFIENNANMSVVQSVNGIDVVQNLNWDLGTSRCFNVPSLSCSDQIERFKAFPNETVPAAITTCSKTGYVFGDPNISPVCDSSPGDSSWFEVLEAYYGFGKFLDWISLFTIVFYFCTSSDSGSLVVDAIASNGSGFSEDEFVSIVQRVFWALTEGGVATALLVAGGRNSLSALQAASICAGLPYTALLCMMCTALWRALSDNAKNPDSVWVGKDRNYNKDVPAFKIDFVGGAFDCLEFVFSFGRTSKVPVASECIHFALAVVCPPIGVFAALKRDNPPGIKTDGADGNGGIGIFNSTAAYNYVTTFAIGLLFYGWVLFMFLELAEDGLWAFGWVSYISFAILLSSQRTLVRKRHGISGNVFEDFFGSVFLYPQVVAQIAEGAVDNSEPSAKAIS